MTGHRPSWCYSGHHWPTLTAVTDHLPPPVQGMREILQQCCTHILRVVPLRSDLQNQLPALQLQHPLCMSYLHLYHKIPLKLL